MGDFLLITFLLIVGYIHYKKNLSKQVQVVRKDNPSFIEEYLFYDQYK